MKTCDEMVNSLLKRREQFLSEQKQKRKTAAKITAAGGSCALAAVIGVGVWNSGMLRDKKTILPDNSSAISDSSFAASDGQGNSTAQIPVSPTVPDFSSVIWAEEGVDTNISIGEDAEGEFDSFNGKIITRALSETFNKYSDDSVFAVGVFYIPYEEYIDDDFVYNGKTFGRYHAEFIEEWWKGMALLYLRNNGEYLKYGEALYQEGMPDINGYEWTKEKYDDAVEIVGEEYLSEYIVDGEFLKDKLLRDIDIALEASYASLQVLKQARAAYKAQALENTAERLSSQGIYCELRNGSEQLIVFVTKDEFAELTFDDTGSWIFGMAQEKENDVLGHFVED